jgi:cell wall integrity and stress response component
MRTLPVLLATVVASASAQSKGQQLPSQVPVVNALTSHGCFKSSGSLKNPEGYEPSKVSRGFCDDDVCNKMNATAFALKGQACFCGFEYPPEEDLVDDENCNFPCPAYPLEACGGIGSGSFFSVFNTGVDVDVPYAKPVQSEDPSSTSAASDSSQTGDTSDEPEEKKTNVGGIVGGVVVGVVAVAAGIGGVFFFLRRKRNREIEEEHRRNAAVNSFIGHKPPSSSGGLSLTDARLDPVMAQRRMSDGSIADNHDYSRKILRVTNA